MPEDNLLRSGDAAGGSDDDANRVNARNIVLGLLGRGIEQSKSPFMHESEGDAHRLRLTYRLVDFDRLDLPDEELGAVLAAARWFGVDGLNITYPFKQRILPLLDVIDDDAAIIGAVNTVVFDNDKSKGYNTDLYGFGENFQRSLSGERCEIVVQLGAGGAGAATAAAMLSLGCKELHLVDCEETKSATLARRLAKLFPDAQISAVASIEAVIEKADGLVNATPIGMSSHPGTPVDLALLRSDLWVADIVYFPAETQLLSAARKIGCRTLDGVGMAVYQAAASFDLFTGLSADRKRMMARFSSQFG